MAKEKLIPSVDYESCMACRVCIISCPFSCLEDSKTGVDKYGKTYPELIALESCTGCGICAKNCPVEVISMIPA